MLKIIFYFVSPLLSKFTYKIKFMTFDKEKILEYCNRISKNTLMETLNIEYVDAGEDFFDSNNASESTVHQPMGLYIGASVALAESVGSAASFFILIRA
jgi:acyl-coenzyme A thioesterase PaaI-like protein